VEAAVAGRRPQVRLARRGALERDRSDPRNAEPVMSRSINHGGMALSGDVDWK